MAKTKKYYTTPEGIFSYPYLLKPDMGNDKFTADPAFKVDLRLSVEDAAGMMELLNKAADAGVAQAKKNAKTPADAKKVKRMPPYELELDEAGEETGMVTFKFRMAETVKAGKTWDAFTQKPAVYDKKGKFEGDAIFGGTKGLVNYWINVYDLPPKKQDDVPAKGGASLKLRAVQITELVAGGLTAESCGFELDNTEEPPFEADAGGSDDEENEDF